MVLQTGAAFTAHERAKGGAPVGVSLLANALGQSMHQLAEMHFAGKLLQAISCASGFQPRARSSGVLDGRQQSQAWIVIRRLRGWRGVNGSGCLHTVVGARLPANALGQSMHQCLAEMHFADRRAPTGDQFRFRVPGGAGHDPDQALLRVRLVANWPGSDRPPRITPQVLYHEPTFILRAASLVPVEARCDERFATHCHSARV
jgi:hypothetical protein